MVAREGIAPSTSLCRRDMILFHHRAKLAASPGFAPGPSGSKPGMLRLHHEAMNWWPARVTRPVLRIKSPLHHFNACRPKWCSRQDLHLHWRRSQRRVSSVGLRERQMDPPAGDAPAESLYKSDPQAAAWRQNGRSLRCHPGHGGLMKPT